MRTILDNADSLLALAALTMIGAGCWLERPSLALIVPGSLVFGVMAFARLRGG